MICVGVVGAKPAAAWGPRGHHEICVAATRLVKEPVLRDFLAGRGHTMGHLCNVPDISWRDIESARKDGDPSHYLNPDKIGKKSATMPSSFREVEEAKLADGTRVGHTAGSLWWRADQFFRLAVMAGKQAAAGTPPKDYAQNQDFSLPYNSGVFGMMTAMGLMGHYVGDASMPLHNHSDYDGKAAGHPGIHAFFEDAAVSTFPLTLVEDLRSRASSAKHDYRKGSVVERMRQISVRAEAEIPSMLKADVMTPKRATAEKAAPLFKPLILREMADSAAQLAAFWDEIFVQSGRPNLSGYRAYRYPLVPEFVPPEYLKN